MRRGSLDFDGGCRGNPGRASAAFVLQITDDETGETGRIEKAWPLEKATNNVAEYLALLGGLTVALAEGVDEIVARGDSKLVVEQVAGNWKAKEWHLAALRDQILWTVVKFRSWEIRWIPREQNNEADGLTASILGERQADRAKRQRAEARA